MRRPLDSSGILRRSLVAALAYALVSGVYIVTSDLLVHTLTTSPELQIRISIVKGWLFVATTAVVLFLLLWRLGLAARRAAVAEETSTLEHEVRKVLFDHAPDAVVVIEGERVVAANSAAGLLFGCPAERLVGSAPWELSPPSQPDGRPARDAILERLAAVREGDALRFPWVHRRRDGSDFEAAISLTLLPGSPARTLAFIRDVSEAQRAARKLAQQSEEMRLLVEGTRNFFFYVQGLDGDVSYVSPSVEAITGRPVAQWLGQHHWFATGAPTNRAAIEATRRHLRGELDSLPMLIELEHADGHPVLLEIYEFGRYQDGKLVGLQGIAQDVTRRHEAEEKFRKIFDNAVEGIYQTTPAGAFVTANPMLARLLGYDSPEQLIAAGNGRSNHFYLEPGRREEFLRLVSGRDSLTGLESQMVCKDGSVIWVSENVRVVRGADGGAVLYEGTLIDITEHKRAEEALRQSEQTARVLLNTADAAAVLLDTSGNVLAMNETASVALGVPAETLVGRCLYDLFDSDLAQGAKALAAHVLASANGRRFVERWNGRDYSISVFPVVDPRGVASRLAAFARDITDQRQAEQALQRLATAVEQAAEMIVVTDTESRIEYVNPAFTTITGYSRSEALGQKMRILKSGKHDPAVYADLWRTLKTGGTWSGKLVNRRKDGSLYEEEATISPVRDGSGKVVNFVAVKRDVTEQAALQAQLRQSQKMEAVGQLAGGVAHDFNNLLQAAMSTVDLLRVRGDDPVRRAAAVGELESYVKRGAALTRQLLLFSRRSVTRRERLDLGEVVRATSSLLLRLVRENIRTTLALDPAPLPIRADRGQLEQVLVNLVVNASDAMPDGGELVIRTGGDGEEKVWFEVHDTGVGIPEELHARIFEPFFTTKEPEKGTGLGLSVVHGIVTAHGGRLSVSSEVGSGTAIRVELPRGERSWDDEPEPEASARLLPAALEGRGEHVLLVEDEDGARDGMREMLAMLGYKVTPAPTGEAAEALAAEGRFEVLLTDLLLPGLGGGELAKRLRAGRDGLRVIIMSGYARDEAVRVGLSEAGAHFLQKPFSLDQLARELRLVLDGPPS